MTQQAEHPLESPQVSSWGALISVLTDPVTTFQGLAQRAPILPPYLLSMVATVSVVLLTMEMQLQLQADAFAKQGVEPPPTALIMIPGVLFAAAMPWLAGLLVAFIAWLFGKFQQTEVRFGAYMSMAGYAAIPSLIGGLIQGGMIMFANDATQAMKMSLSPAVFVPDADLMVKAFLQSINPFDIWHYILMAVGFAALHRIKPVRGAAFAVTYYLLVLGFVLAGAKIGQMFGGLQ